MYTSLETLEQTERRLGQIAAASRIEVLDGLWWYEEFPLAGFPARGRTDAIALVRDSQGWSQLVPVGSTDRPIEQFRVWCCHFPPGMDNSGFVGWLASHIKARTGSGVFVVCGQNSGKGGIYDYWGCPAQAANAVLAELGTLTGDVGLSTSPSGRLPSLDGLSMRPTATSAHGEIDPETLFVFSQEGDVVSARYAGGTVRLGFLVGTRSGNGVAWRYAQLDPEGRLHGGHSLCELSALPNGRMKLVEHFNWDSWDGSGSNHLEQVASAGSP
jgi:hypothetical protein